MAEKKIIFIFFERILIFLINYLIFNVQLNIAVNYKSINTTFSSVRGQLTDSHLTYTHLTESHLTDSHLTYTHLTESHLTDSHLTYTHLTDNRLTYTHLTESHLTDKTLDRQIFY
jgi:uncharacterized protein YjbI with pentapeptide repeats